LEQEGLAEPMVLTIKALQEVIRLLELLLLEEAAMVAFLMAGTAVLVLLAGCPVQMAVSGMVVMAVAAAGAQLRVAGLLKAAGVATA
jgi:hypothetical protein